MKRKTKTTVINGVNCIQAPIWMPVSLYDKARRIIDKRNAAGFPSNMTRVVLSALWAGLEALEKDGGSYEPKNNV